MNDLRDTPARVRALTELKSTLLVEAAAGTGKTALMAARIAYLLAQGGDSANLAAITFTELAASALAERVHHYVNELLGGDCPKPLAAALPNGLSKSQKANLRTASSKLNELTVSTIHAFCQTIITSYAVEADIDPGAQILDADQASIVFDSAFERWLKGRLNRPLDSDDPIATLSKDEPRRIVETLRELARFRMQHRGARPIQADLSGRPDLDFCDSVSVFRRWFSVQPPEPKTEQLISDFEQLAGFFANSFEQPPGFARLWELGKPPRVSAMRGKDSLELKIPRLKTAWHNAARQDGSALEQQILQHFRDADQCYRVMLGRIATALVAKLSAELDEVLLEYKEFKRAAAVLDFDDLLLKARALVRDHDDVRCALGSRYKHIFVDEFQDTDPIQSEILFQIAADKRAENWQENELRPGALFLVGDPKQSIYRFRRADIGSYAEVRDAIRKRWPDNVVQITANFRSRPFLIGHVNKCFDGPLSGPGQPGYVALSETLAAPQHHIPCVTKLVVDAGHQPKANDIRDTEALVVADACARLIGNMVVSELDGKERQLQAGDITLLSPSWTQLWRYERALEERGLPVASQAGKGLFRRQETQDLLALARTLADGRDRIAFGAMMRGPLVGLTDDELLDITESLPRNSGDPPRNPRFDIYTDTDDVAHSRARETLALLQALRRRVRSTTPALLLAEAIDRLQLRAILSARQPQFAGRALANVEAFLERARPYGVRGLKHFVRDVMHDWQNGVPCSEGQQDSDENAIKLITVHSAKGLEWPVVIPINTATGPRSPDPYVHRMSDDTLHWLLGAVAPPELEAALAQDDRYARLEQERLWYVACTRARELLIIPQIPSADVKSWAKLIDLKFNDLAVLDVKSMREKPREALTEPENRQAAEVFAAEQSALAGASAPFIWTRPSTRDADRLSVADTLAVTLSDAPETALPIGAGRIRGLVLHKLMEELLTGELGEEISAAEGRARVLITELADEDYDAGILPDAEEAAATSIRTLNLPEIRSLRPMLVPEWPVYGMLANRPALTALAGRLDAADITDGRVRVVVDWKSDIASTNNEIRNHVSQVRDYLEVTGADRGALVYMSRGQVRWVDRD